MIYSINGSLQLVETNFIAVDVQGVGYGIKTTMTTISCLPPIGETVFLYTYLNVREDAMELFGFYDKQELDCFKLLITVNGVGPKAALSLLSDNTPGGFAMAVAAGDAKALTRSAGIGAKTAQRIVLELKDKITGEQLTLGVGSSGVAQHQAISVGNAGEAIAALTVLGYAQGDAASVVSAMDPSLPVDELIKAGLKQLASKL